MTTKCRAGLLGTHESIKHVYQQYFYNKTNQSDFVYQRCLSIPCSTNITDEDLKAVCEKIKVFKNDTGYLIQDRSLRVSTTSGILYPVSSIKHYVQINKALYRYPDCNHCTNTVISHTYSFHHHFVVYRRA